MININGDSTGFFNITQTPGMDYGGKSTINVDILPGPTLEFMQTSIAIIEAKLVLIEIERENERNLLDKYPAVKDLHDQYKAIKILVQKNE